MSINLKALITEHGAIEDIDDEDECYTGGVKRINYIEGFYVGDFTPKIFENLRFYRRTKGKYAGRTVSLYVNPKTGKSYSGKQIINKYMEEVDKKLSDHLAPIKRIDVNIFRHARTHIRAKIIKNQKETLSRLRKEKERN